MHRRVVFKKDNSLFEGRLKHNLLCLHTYIPPTKRNETQRNETESKNEQMRARETKDVNRETCTNTHTYIVDDATFGGRVYSIFGRSCV